eukprot:11910295-Ditylum_brightwellii.AAC.1
MPCYIEFGTDLNLHFKLEESLEMEGWTSVTHAKATKLNPTFGPCNEGEFNFLYFDSSEEGNTTFGVV